MLLTLDEIKGDLYRWATSDIVRVPLGYDFFDSRTQGGMAPGQVMIFLARTGVGKTWFLLNVAANNPSIPTVFFSLEMHGRYIMARRAGLFTNRSTRLVEEQAETGKSELGDFTSANLPLLAIEDEPALGLGDMAEMLDQYTKKIGREPRLVLIDYLELISTFGETQMDSVQGMGRALKNFARERDVALIVLHQVKRGDANAGHKPLDLTDGKFGGEESADYVLGMYKPNLNPALGQQLREQMETDIRLQFLKTRTGGGIHPDGVQHVWVPDSGRIVCPKYRDKPELDLGEI